MSIKIDIPSYLQSFTNNQEIIEVKGNTVGECLAQLIKQFAGMRKMLFTKDNRLHGYVSIYINGEDAYPNELARPVKDKDKIMILYIIGGG